MSERAQGRVIDHSLEKLRILPAVAGLSRKQEIVQPDGGGAESVRLDQVRARLEILRVDFLDHLRLCQEEDFVAALQVLALPIRETLPAEVLLRQFVTLHHRAHGAVEHDDALAHERFEGMQNFRRHRGGT